MCRRSTVSLIAPVRAVLVTDSGAVCGDAAHSGPWRGVAPACLLTVARQPEDDALSVTQSSHAFLVAYVAGDERENRHCRPVVAASTTQLSPAFRNVGVSSLKGTEARRTKGLTLIMTRAAAKSQ